MKRCLACAAAAILLLAVGAADVFAGGMNAAEARLYSAAGGTFTLNGKVYRAYGNYLEQVREYLCRDDVDLTDSQADSKISMIHNSGNIQIAIDSGYIYQIGVEPGYEDIEKRQEDTKKDDGEQYELFEGEDSDSKPYYDEEEYKSSDTYKNNREEIEEGGKRSDELIAAVDSAAEEKAKQDAGQFQEILGERSAREESASSIEADAQSGRLQISGINVFFRSLITGEKDALSFYRTGFFVICIVMLVISIFIAVILYQKQCFHFQIKKNTVLHSRHEQRKRVRKSGSVILGTEVAIHLFILLFCTGFHFAVFQEKHITDIMIESGSYHVAYNQMIDDVHTLLKEENCMENLCDESLGYDEFLFDSNNQMRQALNGKKSDASYSDVSDNVADVVAQVPYLTDEDADRVGQEVVSIYKKAVQSEAGTFVYNIKSSVDAILKPGMLVLAVNLVFAIVLLVLMQHYVHRGVRNLARAVAAAAVGTGICLMFLVIGRPFEKIYISPDSLYVFAYCSIQWILKIFALVFAGGLIAAILLWLIARFMKSVVLKR